MNKNLEKLIKILDKDRYLLNEPLSKHTTVKIGGPADIFYKTNTTEELIKVVKEARKVGVPVTLLGWGSNILVSDNGIRGIVIRNNSKTITIGEDQVVNENNQEFVKEVKARWQSDKTKGTFKYEFKDLDYDESKNQKILVKMDSGVDLPFAINYLIMKGVTGLQWYSRIPGTVGGAIYNNIHGGTHFIHEVVNSVRVIDENNEIKTLTSAELNPEYDESRFHDTNEIILDTEFKLFKGEVDKAKYVALEWAKRKSIQPQNTPGCVFKNITNEEKDELGYPTTGIGYVVEHVLKMSDFHVGDAYVSTKHHNFIENKGSATAKDYISVIKEIQTRAKNEIGIDLSPEIFFLGFEEEELKGIL